jgi:NAD(P)-dependent dehydrogenase (short-subunit alcohol dehydrogenase family)
MIDFRGKGAVVTGSASGIGLEVAKALAAEGARVALLDVRREALDKAVAEVRAGGGEALGVPTDVSDSASLKAAAKTVIGAFGKLHVLVNNAGVMIRGPRVFEVEDEVWDWILKVNLYGLVHSLRTFAPLIASHGEGGHILNTGSISGFLSARRQTGIYTTTKFAITGLTESLADELAGTGIGVSLLIPGGVNTGFYATSAQLRGSLGGVNPFAEQQPETADFMSPAEVAARAIAGVKAGRLYIATHPECRRLHEDRHSELMAAYDAAGAWKGA